MRAYTSLREIVRGAGGTLVEEHLSPEVFGSAYAVFVSRSGGQFRLVWDGKESYGLLQAQASSEEWKDQGTIVRKRHGGKFSNLPEFLATVEGLVVSGTAQVLVYVALLGEGTEVWRPVAAAPVSATVFRLLGTVPEEESWQFPSGSNVRCVSHVFSDGEPGLVAVEAVDA
jgi:hypothetical protein